MLGYARRTSGASRRLRRLGGLAFDKIAWTMDRLFDYRLGVDTSGVVRLSALNIPSGNIEHGHRYEPTPTNVCKRVLRHLLIDHSEYVFIDYGSGKGRMLLMASNYPFAQVIGVEFSQELHRIAQRNLNTCITRQQRCFDRRSVWVDAAEYEPPEANLVIYLHNSFDDVVLARVLERVKPLALSKKIILIYLEAKHAAVVNASEAFPYKQDIAIPRILWRRPGAYSSLIVYSNHALSPGPVTERRRPCTQQKRH